MMKYNTYIRTSVKAAASGVIGAISSTLLLCGPGSSARETNGLKPPETRTVEVVDVYHGVEVVDPYRWLEDGQSEETRAWIDAQNKYTRSLLDRLPFRDQIKQRLSKLVLTDEVHYVHPCDNGYVFHKRKAGQELPAICRCTRISDEDEILIDPAEFSADNTVSVELSGASKDGLLIAYALRRGGEDEAVIRFFDAELGEDLSDELPRAYYSSCQITADGSRVYYAVSTETGPRLRCHVMGTGAADDAELFGSEYDTGTIIWPSISDDGNYLLISVIRGVSDRELHLLDLREGGPVIPLVQGIAGKVFGTIADGMLYFFTDWEAPRGRLLEIDLLNPARENWREVIPECEDRLLWVSPVGGKLAALYHHELSSAVRIFETTGKESGEIPLPDVCSVTNLIGRWDAPELLLRYDSFLTPATYIRYDLGTGSCGIWAQAGSDVRSEDYVVKQVWYNSKDDTRVPMFIVHQKDVPLDGSNLTLMTGYGGFAAAMRPHYNAQAALWVEYGGVFVSTNLRGGGEFGEEWHQAGILANKQNTFDDFIAAAEWLVGNGYTTPEKLAITGSSNGGLLVGAALTQRPELFRAAICGYPLLDMLRYINHPVTRFWITEYGSPEESAQFEYLYAYSPYHNVTPDAEYPATLFVTGDKDTRVDPFHARKMTAALQAVIGEETPVLLRYDTTLGHSGIRAASMQIEEWADELSFLFWQLDMPF